MRMWRCITYMDLSEPRLRYSWHLSKKTAIQTLEQTKKVGAPCPQYIEAIDIDMNKDALVLWLNTNFSSDFL